ncbi:MAG: class I SAM-dependent methyltransferase [Planctomycetes bacterium]|nr:class I SAM-dependent methyltransferase [Planctomycetota bacterium]
MLDVGAGAGCHALALQRRGHAVTALDVSPSAVAVLRARGVRDVRLGSLGALRGETFDTLLLLMHGAGLGGDVPGLQWMLADARRLLAPRGAIVLDSRAPEPPDGRPLDAHSDVRYPGVAELSMEFDGTRGAPFLWLFVDEQRLARIADRAGYEAAVVHREPDGRYLARLTPTTTR